MLIKYKAFRFYGVFMALISISLLSGCAELMQQHKPDDGADHGHIEKHYTISFDAKGNFVVKDGKGRRVDKSSKFRGFPIKTTRIHSIKNYTVVHYEGSDCIAITSAAQTDSFCFTH